MGKLTLNTRSSIPYMHNMLIWPNDTNEFNLNMYNLHTKTRLTKRGEFSFLLAYPKIKVSCCIVIKSENSLAIASANHKRILIHNLTTNKTSFLNGHSDGINCLKLLDHGHCLASGSYDETIRIWNLKNLKDNYTLCTCIGSVSCLEQLSNGWVVSAGGNFMEQMFYIWDLNERMCLGSIADHSSFVTCLKALPNFDDQNEAEDECLFANGSYDRTIKIWNSSSGDCLKVIDGHTGIVYGIEAAIINCQLIVISCSADRTIRIWKLKNKSEYHECTRILEGHTKEVKRVKLNVNRDDQLLSGSEDGHVKVWNVNTGECVESFSVDFPISGLEFCP